MWKDGVGGGGMKNYTDYCAINKWGKDHSYIFSV
jgi:hypothetical protein